MLDDLDDLFDDDVPTKQTVAQRNTSSVVNKFGGGVAKKASDDLDGLGDSFNFDEVLGVGGSKPSAQQKQSSFGGGNYTGLSSAKNTSKPPTRMDNSGDDTFFGVGRGVSATNAQKPTTTGFGQAESFGGGSRFGGGSNFGGSKKSQAEVEADEFDALLDDITKPEPGAAENPGAGQPMPTGTFRNSENDGWDDLNFGESKQKTGGSGAGNNRFGASAGYKPGGILSSKNAMDDDDILDNMLDDIAQAKGMDPVSKRPQTAAVNSNFNDRKESLWSAGGPNAGRPINQGTASKYGGMDLEDDLAGFGDDDEDEMLGSGLNKMSSANKASSH